ncbi:MAG: hypothetical protein ACE5Z5_09160 [Candidatus Bathyarchaeia archaeon]
MAVKMDKRKRVRVLSTVELLAEHDLCHAWATDNYGYKPDDWTIEEIEERHDEIITEMGARGITMSEEHRIGTPFKRELGGRG